MLVKGKASHLCAIACAFSHSFIYFMNYTEPHNESDPGELGALQKQLL